MFSHYSKFACCFPLSLYFFYIEYFALPYSIYIVSTLAYMIGYDTIWVFFEGILKKDAIADTNHYLIYVISMGEVGPNLIWTIISLIISPRIRWLVVVIIQVAFISIYSGQMSSSLGLPMLWLLKVPKCWLGVFESWIWLCYVNNTKLGVTNWGLGKHYTVVNFGHHWFR